MFKKVLITNLSKLGEAGIYFVYGIIMLLLGRIVWNLITKYKTNEEIGEKDNPSAGIAEFGFLIALAIIILASLIGTRKSTTPIYIDIFVSFFWGIFGIIALAIGKFILDLVTPFKIDAEISRDRNPAAGWLQAGFYIALSVILFGII